MKITRDVITDLLPAYWSGEASQDTQDLIAAFLKDDPEFGRLVETEKENLLPDPRTHLPKETEMQTLAITRALLRKRSLFLAFAIFFTCFAFAFTFDGAGLHWLWTRQPLAALLDLASGSGTAASIPGIVSLVVGLFFWAMYLRTDRGLRGSGL